MAQATQAKKRGFNEAAAKPLPTLVCIGYVAAVTDGRLAKSGNFNVLTVEINGTGAGKNHKVYPCTRPEWFETDDEGNQVFKPESLNKVEGGKSLQAVYANNISSKEGPSTLRGLAGSDERFDILTEALLTDTDVADENQSAEAVEKVLDRVLVAKQGEEPFEIGYVLKQQSEKTDRKDENGKTVYVKTKYYDLDTFFDVTEANKKKYRKIAEKSAKRAEENGESCLFKVTFDEASPF